VRTSRWFRLGLVALGIAVVAAGSLAFVRLRDPASSRAAAASAVSRTVIAGELAHTPWFGMTLLHADISFREGRLRGAPPPSVPATASILVDLDSGQILWERNPYERLPMASTIKVLTAMVALHNFSLTQPITVTPDALFQAGDESKMFLKAGETLSTRELLTGMLMVSANDAADVLAIDTVGMERFVGTMNAQTRALGLNDTHVVTPVGLDAPDQYSSAYDLAVLSAVDVDTFPAFGDIVRTRQAYLPSTATHPAFYLNNINLLLGMYPAAVGLKTGYTGNAGACEIGMAVRNGHRLLSVVLSGHLVYTESRRLLDWGFVQEGLPSQLPAP